MLESLPKAKVIALSMHTDKRFVMGMLRAGASGYLLKDCAYDELVKAVRTVFQDRSYLSSRITDVVMEDYVDKLKGGESKAFTVLSARERETLQLLAEGLNTKEIAARMGVSAKTIETHRRGIMNKLDLHSVAELTKFAIREGLTSLGE